MKDYRICIVQTTSYKEGIGHNLARAEKAVREAASGGASLVIFPEMYLSGYDAGERLKTVCEAADGPSEKRMAELAAGYGIHMVYGYPENRNGRVYNSANLIDDHGALRGTYRKTRLFMDERSAFAAGDAYPVFETKLGRVGLLICYDIEFPEPARRLASKGADIIVCIAANMAPYHELHRRFSAVRAFENSVPVAYCNFTGSDDCYEYTGRSGLYVPDAEAMCCAEAGKSDMDGINDLTEDLIFEEVILPDDRAADDPFGYLSCLTVEEKDFYTV